MKLDLSNIELSRNDIKRKIKIPQEITEDLAYFIGILAGDGCICIREHKKDYRVYCGGNPKNEIEFYDKLIIPLIKNLFNIDVKGKLKCDGTYSIDFGSKGVIQFLTKIINLPIGKKYDKLKIPLLFKENEDFILAFVRGLFDTDFGFCLSKKYRNIPYYPQIAFVSKSESFTREIWLALKKLGIRFNGKIYRVLNKDDRAKAGFTIIYRFDLYGHNYFINILKIIKLRHPKHIKKFREWTKINKNNPRVIKLLKIAEVGVSKL